MSRKSNRVLEEAIRLVGVEFQLSRRDIGELKRGKESLARYMAVSLARETLGFPPDDELKKYLTHIPGLKANYKKLMRKLQKKLVDFDV